MPLVAVVANSYPCIGMVVGRNGIEYSLLSLYYVILSSSKEALKTYMLSESRTDMPKHAFRS